MFTNVLRSQARLSLLKAARVAVPATRSLSSLMASRIAPRVSSAVASRTFANTAVAQSYHDREAPRNPPSGTLFVGNLPWSVTKQEVEDVMAEFGKVSEVRLPTHADGRPRGFAHVSFVEQASAEAAYNSGLEEPLHMRGRDLVLDYATEKRTESHNIPPNNKLYFSNFQGDDAGLRQLFQEYESKILDTFFLRDGNSGAALNAGFIEFSSQDVATKALNALANSELPSGEQLQLSYARPKRERSDPSGASRHNGRGTRGSSRPGHYNKREWSPRD